MDIACVISEQHRWVLNTMPCLILESDQMVDDARLCSLMPFGKERAFFLTFEAQSQKPSLPSYEQREPKMLFIRSALLQ